MSNATKLISVLIAAAVLVYLLFVFDVFHRNTVDDFATCAGAGNKVDDSFPRKCIARDSKIYYEPVSKDSLDNVIKVDSPTYYGTVSSPLTVSGKARGFWFFEASFPVEVVSEDGTILASGAAHTKENWMTSDFVPFSAVVSLSTTTSASGFVRLMRDNPSGIAGADARLDIPVYFGPIRK